MLLLSLKLLPAGQRLRSLEAALIEVGLDDDLDVIGGEHSVFGPTDTAFNAYFSKFSTTQSEFLARADLTEVFILSYLTHCAEQSRSLVDQLGDNRRDELRTLQGKKIILDDVNDQTLWVNDASISAPYRDADNGIVHYIDGVLLPPMDLLPTLEARGLNVLHEALNQELEARRLELPGRPNTLLAPTDDAFTAFLTPYHSMRSTVANASLSAMLADHVVDERTVASVFNNLAGEDVTTAAGESYPISVVNGVVRVGSDADVTARNIPYNGGVIHVLDAALTGSYVDEMQPTGDS